MQGAKQSGLPDRAKAEPGAARPEGKRPTCNSDSKKPWSHDDGRVRIHLSDFSSDGCQLSDGSHVDYHNVRFNRGGQYSAVRETMVNSLKCLSAVRQEKLEVRWREESGQSDDRPLGGSYSVEESESVMSACC